MESNEQAADNVQILLVPSEEIPRVWTLFQQQIGDALAHGAGESEDAAAMLRRLFNGDSVMLAAQGEELILGCLVYSIKQYTKGSAVFVELIAGKQLDKWVESMEEALVNIQTHAEADMIEGISRPGMTKLLKNWRQKAVIMEYNHG